MWIAPSGADKTPIYNWGVMNLQEKLFSKWKYIHYNRVGGKALIWNLPRDSKSSASCWVWWCHLPLVLQLAAHRNKTVRNCVRNFLPALPADAGIRTGKIDSELRSFRSPNSRAEGFSTLHQQADSQPCQLWLPLRTCRCIGPTIASSRVQQTLQNFGWPELALCGNFSYQSQMTMAEKQT